MKPLELVAALTPVAEAFEALGVRYFVGGSLSSSAHGVPRASIDVDLVADLRPEHVDPLIERLAGSYYVPEDRVRDGVARRRSFNLIHLETMLKVDVFVQRGRPFDEECLRRARPMVLDEGGRGFPLASAEDIVIAKLESFRAGGEQSERQWTDILGVLRAARPHGLDRDYLFLWAARVQILDLLQRALEDAGEPA